MIWTSYVPPSRPERINSERNAQNLNNCKRETLKSCNLQTVRAYFCNSYRLSLELSSQTITHDNISLLAVVIQLDIMPYVKEILPRKSFFYHLAPNVVRWKKAWLTRCHCSLSRVDKSFFLLFMKVFSFLKRVFWHHFNSNSHTYINMWRTISGAKAAAMERDDKKIQFQNWKTCNISWLSLVVYLAATLLVVHFESSVFMTMKFPAELFLSSFIQFIQFIYLVDKKILIYYCYYKNDRKTKLKLTAIYNIK